MRKIAKVSLLLLLAAGCVYGSYRAGFADGADAYCYRVRQEMKPVLSTLVTRAHMDGNPELKLLVSVADDSKMMPAVYSKFVSAARESIQRQNQAPEPTR